MHANRSSGNGLWVLLSKNKAFVFVVSLVSAGMIMGIVGCLTLEFMSFWDRLQEHGMAVVWRYLLIEQPLVLVIITLLAAACILRLDSNKKICSLLVQFLAGILWSGLSISTIEHAATEFVVFWYMRSNGIVHRSDLGEDLGFGMAGFGVDVVVLIISFVIALTVWTVVIRKLITQAASDGLSNQGEH